MSALSAQGKTQFCRSKPERPFNNVKLKDFMKERWEQKRTPLNGPDCDTGCKK